MIFTLKADPYQSDVVFSIAEDIPAIERYMRKHHGASDELMASLKENLEHKAKNMHGRTLCFDNGTVFIHLKHRVIGSHTMGLLVHEVLHAVSCIFGRVGIPFSDDTEEAWCYLQQSLCQQAFKRIGDKHWK